MIEIRHFAAGCSLPSEIDRFRYQVYVENRGLRDLPGVDGRKKVFRCVDDPRGHFQVAFQGDEVVGLVRGIYTRDLSTRHALVQLYRLDEASADQRENGSISTQLMVADSMRRTSLGARLVAALYKQTTSDGIHWDFLDCNAGVEPFFHRFGYRRHLGMIDRPGIGEVVSMVLPAVDREHLIQARSPLARFCPKEPEALGEFAAGSDGAR